MGSLTAGGNVGKCGIIQVRFLFTMYKVLLIKFQYNIQESFLIQNPVHVDEIKNMSESLREILLFLNVD